MAFTNTYLRISTANYEALPIPQPFLNKRGPLYFPPVGEADPVAYEGSTHQILALPNLSQIEIKEILAAADAIGFDLDPVILAHDEIQIYKLTGTLPPA